MVDHTSKCLEFHTARIQKISVNTVAVMYLSTNEKDIVPIRHQVQSSEQVGRDIERRQVEQSNAINPDSGIIQGTSPEERIDAHTRYANNCNEWKKRSLTKIGLAKWKSSRNKLPWCKEGGSKTILSKITCIPVSLTVLGLVKTPEDTIQGLNQSVDKVALHDNSRITEGSDYATVWCPPTVHTTIGHLGWSCRKVTSKNITKVGMYLIEGTQNNCISDIQLFRYPISMLVGQDGQAPQHNNHYFLWILKFFSIKSKGRYE